MARWHGAALEYIVVYNKLARFSQINSLSSYILCIQVGLVLLDFQRAPVIHFDAILMAHHHLRPPVGHRPMGDVMDILLGHRLAGIIAYTGRGNDHGHGHRWLVLHQNAADLVLST